MRILVVDDEPTLTELLQMALRYEGCDVRIAATGHAAVRAAKEFQPDAMVLDMMLPDLDGIEVLRRVRGHRPAVPVLFLTARDSVEDRIAGLDLRSATITSPSRFRSRKWWRACEPYFAALAWQPPAGSTRCCR